MRFIKLAANRASFRTVKFNRSGVSFVIAQKKQDVEASRTKTYNGVGKSLLIAILHFCLGSNAVPAFKKHLRGWIFYLTVELDGKEVIISRAADEPSTITFDGKKTTLKALREELQVACFAPFSGDGLSFRSLVGPFLRSHGGYANFRFAKPEEAKREYYPLLRNCFLLGIDLKLVREKYRLRKRYTSLTKTMSELQSDPAFSDLLEDDSAIIELTSLREEQTQLENDLAGFQVSEDYTEIQSEANDAKRALDLLRRQVVKLEDAIGQIDRSMQVKEDLDRSLIERVYNEARIWFPNQVTKQLDEVLEFQASLSKNRTARLTAERQHFVDKKKEIVAEQAILEKRLNKMLAFLGSHMALDEFVGVNNRLGEVKQKIARLEISNEHRSKVKRELRLIERDLAEEAIKADEYLESAKPLLVKTNAFFRSLTKALYGPRASGLTITNDIGDNQSRFQIDCHITADAAEGINEAKIFCYDLLILSQQRNHLMHTLVHDSTLFQPIDSRQRFSALRLAKQISESLQIQYVAMLNEHDIVSMQNDSGIEEREFESLFQEKNVILKLTDQSPKDKLLGISVDMNYVEE